MNKSVVWGGAAGVVVLVMLLAWMGLRQTTEQTGAVSATSGETRGAPGGMSAGSELPRIGASGGVSPTGDQAQPDLASAAKGFKPPQPGAPTLQAIQTELQALSAHGRQPSPMEVDAVLAKLEQNQGSSVVAGYDLKALRANMQAAERIRVVTDQMQGLAKDPTPENTQKLMDLMKELQKIQGEIRLDITASKP